LLQQMTVCFQHGYIYHNTGVDIDRNADMDMDNKDRYPEALG